MKRILTEKEYQDISEKGNSAIEKLEGLLSNEGYMEIYCYGEYSVSSLQFLKSAEIVEKMEKRAIDDYDRLLKKYKKLKEDTDKQKEEHMETIHEFILKTSKLEDSMNIWNKIVLYFTK